MKKYFIFIALSSFFTSYGNRATVPNKLISYIVPVYNEQETINLLYTKLLKEISKLKDTYTYEILFIDDGSSDNSWELIRQLANQNKQVKAVHFTRNFGHQVALSAGYTYAQGHALITLDCDLQDPPALINDLIDKWQQGFPVVYARRIKRQDTWFKRTTALLYYKLLNTVSDYTIPSNVGDFRLIDKQVASTLNAMPEHGRYLRGLIAWTGYKYTFVDFQRAARCAGESHYTLKKMLTLARDGLIGFSSFPFVATSYTVLFILLLVFIFALVSSKKNFQDLTFIKWALILSLFILVLQCCFLWIQGQYIQNIYNQVRQRPLYIIDQTLNL